jgi:hypothetical protein
MWLSWWLYAGQVLKYAINLLHGMRRDFVYGLLTNLKEAVLIRVENADLDRMGGRTYTWKEALIPWISSSAPADGVRVLLRLGQLSASELGAPERFRPLVKDWELKYWVGDGSLCSVFSANRKGAGHIEATVAVKRFRKSSDPERVKISYKQELAALKAIKASAEGGHSKMADYFLKLEGYEEHNYFVFSPVCQSFDSREERVLEPSHVRQLMLALRFLHTECSLVHWDIAPKHVKCSSWGSLILIDLGAARPIGQEAVVEGTRITMSQAKLDALGYPGTLTAHAGDDLESAAKTVYLMKDVFLMEAALKAAISRDNTMLEVLWNRHLSNDIQDLCKAVNYEGLLTALTDPYVLPLGSEKLKLKGSIERKAKRSASASASETSKVAPESKKAKQAEASKQTTPKQATSKQAASKQAASKQAASKQAASKQSAAASKRSASKRSKQAASKQAASKQSAAASKRSASKRSAPKRSASKPAPKRS